jgi:predicted phage gp36 major capsid-like protein
MRLSEHKLYPGLALGGIIALSGATLAVDSKGAMDYSVNSVPGSPGNSSGNANIESDIKTHREAVRDANDAQQQAITRYGRDSREARKAGRNLDEEHTQLERNLYQHGQVPGSASSTQKMSGEQPGKSTLTVPIRQMEF